VVIVWDYKKKKKNTPKSGVFVGGLFLFFLV